MIMVLPDFSLRLDLCCDAPFNVWVISSFILGLSSRKKRGIYTVWDKEKAAVDCPNDNAKCINLDR
jgi:hypothetical protein